MAKKKKRTGGGFDTVTSCISIALVLILLGTVVFTVTFANGLSRNLRENIPVEVLLSDSIPAAEAVRLQTSLKQQPFVKEIHYISKEKATAEMAKALDGSPADFLGTSPIPAEFELYLNADYANSDSLAHYMPLVRQRAFVTDVVYPKDTLGDMDYALAIGSLVLLTVAVLMAFVSFSLINNTMRMSVYARRYTIHSMKLVGAKWCFIRRPFMWRAFGIGLTASLLACAVLAGGMYLLVGLDVYVSALVTPLVAGATLGSVVVAGLALTMLCAFFSVNKHLRMTGGQVFLK